MTVAARHLFDMRREHATPRRRYVLSSAAERFGGPFRAAAARIRKRLVGLDLQGVWELYQPDAHNRSVPSTGDIAERLSWAVVAAWATGVSTGQFSISDDLSTATEWLFGSAGSAALRTTQWARVSNAPSVGSLEGLAGLLPYALDAHGPGSRLSVMRDPSTQTTRQRRKAAGVFYTPADVAAFMVDSILPSTGSMKSGLRVLDLACGTGVFLRAALARLHELNPTMPLADLARTGLFGTDIDPLALDMAAFVLLHDCLAGGQTDLIPLMLWRQLRANLAEQDGLQIDLIRAERKASERVLLHELFPACQGGADVVIGNPPYAPLGQRTDLLHLLDTFESLPLRTTRSADLYPLFVEQMMRLAAPGGCGAVVVPLSIACNTGGQFLALRRLIGKTPGSWRFAFFDREPHALFGEDVKTRNAIVLWNRDQPATRLATGPLRKWRAESRETLFSSIDYTAVLADIEGGIPKLHGNKQADAWRALQCVETRLADCLQDWGKTALCDLPRARPTDVFVAPTAYNFLGVARQTVLPVGPAEALSENSLLRLTAASVQQASAIYAILISNVAFWWWHVHSDGFHVNRATLDDFPVGQALVGEAREALNVIGDEAWALARKRPLRSVNRGRVSYSFPLADGVGLRQQADEVLAQALGLSSASLSDIQTFCASVAAAQMLQVNKNDNEEHPA